MFIKLSNLFEIVKFNFVLLKWCVIEVLVCEKVLNKLFMCFFIILILVFIMLNVKLNLLLCWVILIFNVILFCFVNLIVLLSKLISICFKCVLFFKKMVFLLLGFVLILNWIFLLCVCFKNRCWSLFNILFNLIGWDFSLILEVFILFKFKILLIIINKFELEDWIIVSIFVCFVVSVVLFNCWVIFKILFIGVFILWFILVRNFDFIFVVCFVIFFVLERLWFKIWKLFVVFVRILILFLWFKLWIGVDKFFFKKCWKLIVSFLMVWDICRWKKVVSVNI